MKALQMDVCMWGEGRLKNYLGETLFNDMTKLGLFSLSFDKAMWKEMIHIANQIFGINGCFFLLLIKINMAKVSCYRLSGWYRVLPIA